MTVQSILQKLQPIFDFLSSTDGIKITNSARSIDDGRAAALELKGNLNSVFMNIIGSNGSIQLWTPFELWKADYLAEVLPGLLSDAVQKYWVQKQNQDAKYVSGFVIIAEQLRQQLLNYDPVVIPPIPTNPEPGDPGFIITPGTPTPGTPPPPPPPSRSQNLLPIAIGIGALFAISKL